MITTTTMMTFLFPFNEFYQKKKRKSRDGPRTHDREPSPHCIPARTGTNKTLTHETNELDITNLFYLLETGFMINKNQYPLYIHYNDTTLLHYYTAAVAQRRLHTFFFFFVGISL